MLRRSDASVTPPLYPPSLLASAGSRPLRVGEQKFAETLLLQCAGGKLKDSLRRCFLGGREPIAIEFKKKHADHETGSFVAINERMILHNARRVPCRKLNNIGAFVGGMV